MSTPRKLRSSARHTASTRHAGLAAFHAHRASAALAMIFEHLPYKGAVQ